jgi:cytochrome c oxidase cbb3-type subunit 3
MKFIDYLESISGISIYPMVSLLLFVLFFASVTIWAIRTNNALIAHMKNIPLDSENKK